MAGKRKKKKKKLFSGFKEQPAEVRFAKRDLRKQEDRDLFGDNLVGDMQRALERDDWEEYKRIKALLYRVT